MHKRPIAFSRRKLAITGTAVTPLSVAICFGWLNSFNRQEANAGERHACFAGGQQTSVPIVVQRFAAQPLAEMRQGN
jgi:hypothetical protein